MTRKAIIEVSLVPESEDIEKKQIEKEIMESVKCAWLAEIEKVTVENGT